MCSVLTVNFQCLTPRSRVSGSLLLHWKDINYLMTISKHSGLFTDGKYGQWASAELLTCFQNAHEENVCSDLIFKLFLIHQIEDRCFSLLLKLRMKRSHSWCSVSSSRYFGVSGAPTSSFESYKIIFLIYLSGKLSDEENSDIFITLTVNFKLFPLSLKAPKIWSISHRLIFLPNSVSIRLFPLIGPYAELQAGGNSLHTPRLHPSGCHCALPPAQQTDTPALPLLIWKVKHTPPVIKQQKATINNEHEL